MKDGVDAASSGFNVAGAVILTLAYFGSRIVQQLIS